MTERPGRRRLLGTKLTPPPLPHVVERPRLTAHLDGTSPGRLALLCAPAGSGKTTLAACWARMFPGPVAWLTLDESDNDPDVFMDYTAEALASIAPEIAIAAQPPSVESRTGGVEALLAVAVSAIAARGGPALFVLDDYQCVTEPSVHAALAFLLEHMPAGLQIVLATRTDPPLPTAALRARGRLLEIRAPELCFTLAETERLVNDVRSLRLSKAGIATLHQRTEGWIAGLELATATIRRATDPEAAVRVFGGSDRYVLDYLMDEVFEQQSSGVQEFLLTTSVLDRLCGPLCDAVTRGADGGRMLEVLERQNLFLTPLDRQRTWYRYHALFQDLLSLRLHRRGEAAVRDLHRRASLWLERAGLAGEAISHALRARQWERAAALVEDATEATLAHGENTTVSQWVEALPLETRRRRPLLCVYAAVAFLLTDRSVEAVREHLEMARGVEDDPSVTGGRLGVEAVLALLKGRHGAAVRLFRRALKTLPPGRAFLRSSVMAMLGALFLSLGDLDEAERVLGGLRTDARRADEAYLEVGYILRLGRVERARGRPRAALDLSQEASAICQDSLGGLPLLAGYAVLERAAALMELGDLHGADLAIQGGERILRGVPGQARLSLFALRSQLALARRETESALRDAGRALELARGYDITDLDDRMIEELIARISLAAGDTHAGEIWAARHPLPNARRYGSRGPTPHALQLESETLTHARVRIARGEPEAALALLLPLAESTRRAGHMRGSVTASVLGALALEEAGKTQEALRELCQAAELAGPQGLALPFVEAGTPVARLLHEAARQGPAPVWTCRLLALFPLEGPDLHTVQPSFVEPLSARELEILRLIAAGNTNLQIAESVFISVRTVKWHAGNIFAKLGVRSRTAAIARGRSLGLLPGS